MSQTVVLAGSAVPGDEVSVVEFCAREIAVINTMAECDLSPTRASKRLYYHYNTIIYWCRRVEDKTGLNPRHFYDMVKLLSLIEEHTDGKTK